MVTGVVLAVLLAIGLPSFNQFIVRNQIKASAEAVQNGVQLARAEAVRLNAKVRFTLGAGTSSWSVNVDSGGALVQQSRASGEGGSASVTTTRTPANATQITFNGLGRVVANTDASAILTAVDVAATGGPRTRHSGYKFPVRAARFASATPAYPAPPIPGDACNETVFVKVRAGRRRPDRSHGRHFHFFHRRPGRHRHAGRIDPHRRRCQVPCRCRFPGRPTHRSHVGRPGQP